MDSFEDYLGASERIPRELGAWQVHVEPVRRGEDGRAVVVVWLQAAYEPAPAPLLELRTHDGSDWSEGLRCPFPAPEPGAVLCCRIPLELGAEAVEVGVLQLAGPSEDAVRVRAAWKLTDVHEIGKLSDIEDAEDRILERSGLGPRWRELESLEIDAVANLQDGIRIARAVLPTVRRAAPAADRAVAPVLSREPEWIDEAEWEVAWLPGDLLPGTPPPQRPAAAYVERKTCQDCSYDATPEEAERARSCPRCGAVWLG